MSLLIFYMPGRVNGQSPPTVFPEHPPRPVGITINPILYLNFGSFYHYGVGSVTVYPDGSRDRSGQVFLFSSTPSPGVFEVQGLPGTVISFLDIPDALLDGEFGGQLTLKKGETDPPLPYVLQSGAPVTFKIGGILEVTNPGTTIPGKYDGVYKITVMQE
jgi:hypothetical protein